MEDNAYYNKLWKESPMGRIGCGSPIVATIVITLILAFSSCATKTQIEYRDRVVDHYITKEVHDTLRENTTDSVYFEVIVKGDTVYKTKYKEKTKEIVKYPKTYWWFLGISLISVIFAIVKIVRWLQIR